MTASEKHTPSSSDRSFLAFWQRTPLYLRILAGCVLGVVVGAVIYSLDASFAGLGKPYDKWTAEWMVLPLEIPGKLVLRIMGALATPLVFIAIVQALMHAELPKGSAMRLVSLLLLNTLVAIVIGLAVANTLQPGKWSSLELEEDKQEELEKKSGGKVNGEKKLDPVAQLLENVPKSVLGPFSDEGKVISVILLALAFGIALRKLKQHKIASVADVVEVAFKSLLIILHWVLELIPLAVFGIVASIIATKGISSFVALGGFIGAVLVGLALQTAYYLLRIKFFSWCNPVLVVRGMRDALVMAFSTGSSTATMPVTYANLREKVGLRERSASLGSLVGANFNNDGTALYEAMSALFVSQLIGQDLTLSQQLMVVITSVIASVGAAGIPEAGIVTMTLVFTAVGLPTQYIALLLPVDWFLDRCRTVVNVMGDVNVSCLLDGKQREEREPAELNVIE
jgi:DAACS family dicarboxylate/amino acid:cation (Na+ or H+) symporter